MGSTAYRRYLLVIIAITALLASADICLLQRSSVWVGRGNAAELGAGIGLGAFYIGVGLILRLAAPKTSIVLRPIVARVEAALYDIGAFLGLFFAFTAASCLFMYLAAATKRPLLDADLAAIDQALGFRWLQTVETANSFPMIATVMVFCYASIGYQIPGTALFLVVAGKRERLFEFGATLVVSLMLTDLAMLAVPAAGAYSFYRPGEMSFNHFTAVGGLAHLSTLEHLRSGVPFEFLSSKIIGLTSFPSFHTALGILVTFAARRTILFWPVAAVNAIMVLATIPEGGHHLVDVIGGICVAVAAIAAVRSIGRYERGKAAVGAVNPPSEA
jgi:membrane-associated phospholipid phosphatase